MYNKWDYEPKELRSVFTKALIDIKKQVKEVLVKEEAESLQKLEQAEENFLLSSKLDKEISVDELFNKFDQQRASVIADTILKKR